MVPNHPKYREAAFTLCRSSVDPTRHYNLFATNQDCMIIFNALCDTLKDSIQGIQYISSGLVKHLEIYIPEGEYFWKTRVSRYIHSRVLNEKEELYFKISNENKLIAK